MIGNFARFLLDVRQEILQVSWASRKEVMVSLTVVVISVALSSVLFSCVDFVFLRLVKVMLGVIYEA
ncbi:preprotein translocase subunit SecE [Candidatus Anaplasma sp. TIGMIC]|uniref:preprotein translocase subunit SecE n=1 Tax=Candidatus Anaplasma sp. TIGMIC TaxID=3020713 RepID=UPI00232EE016|nr:preprotein translocase subunit SecE [Candidatus Anaplasma sp. TIGMIC]MDB1135351.1 preprotein translocase subunit SecE [Candidatus Anaplasma sp. TIGMIC]